MIVIYPHLYAEGVACLLYSSWSSTGVPVVAAPGHLVLSPRIPPRSYKESNAIGRAFSQVPCEPTRSMRVDLVVVHYDNASTCINVETSTAASPGLAACAKPISFDKSFALFSIGLNALYG